MDPARPALSIDELLEHQAWLRALARRLVAGDDVDDVEQETWLAALVNPPRDTGEPRSWLSGVLRNIVRQRRRSEVARRSREASVASAERQPSAEGAVDTAESLRRLIDEVLALGEPNRSTLLLRYQDGLTPAQIAKVQGVPSSTVRNRIQRGLAELRERLERRHGREWSALFAPLLVRAPESVTAAATTGGFHASGVFVMGKLLAVAATLVVAAALAWYLTGGAAQPAVSSSVEATQPIDRPTAPVTTPMPAAEMPRELAPGAPTPATFAGTRLLVRVKKFGGGPAAEIHLKVIPWRADRLLFAQRRAVTGADGCARFEGLAAGNCSVWLDRAAQASVEVEDGRETVLDLQLPRGTEVIGRVLDSKSNPIRGAHIWLSDEHSQDDGIDVALSDELGKFRIEGIGADHVIAARAAGFAPSESVQIRDGEGRDEIDLLLAREGGAISGTVRGPDGTPLPSALVIVGEEVTTVGHVPGRTSYGPPPVRLEADAQGKFVVDGLIAGRTRVRARWGEFSPGEARVEVRAGATVDADVRLGGAGAVEGMVLDPEGAPIENVLIETESSYGLFEGESTHSRRDGTYRLVALPPGPAALLFQRTGVGSAGAHVEVGVGETVHVDVRLGASKFVGGRVVDERGEPLANERVSAARPDNNPWGLVQLRTSATDETGRFRIGDWPSDATALMVRAKDAHFGPPELVVRSFVVGAEDLELRVPDSARATAFIVGRVLGPDGQPAAEAKLKFGEGSIYTTYAVENDSGSFRIGPLTSSRYQLAIESDRFGMRRFDALDLAAGETRDLGVIRYDEPGTVHVRLEPEVGVTVNPRLGLSLLDAEGHDVQRIHFANGESTDLHLPPGSYTIAQHGCGLMFVDIPIVVRSFDELDVGVPLIAATCRSFVVRWPATSPVPKSVEFVLRDGGGKERMRGAAKIVTGQAGGSVYDLLVGSYTLEFTADDGRSTSAAFTVTNLAQPDPAVVAEFP